MGRLQHRTFYFAGAGRHIVLLHAFTKKTQKTPRTEIETAVRRMHDFLQRMGRE
ncbi:MAG: type II toxin-antitoxin system RelE/ParE family toxin [Chloroflexi bacterium]|nr:type II toxin-antitoxin system RelE/ParE family toxin [Chloroflexota bacterium]